MKNRFCLAVMMTAAICLAAQINTGAEETGPALNKDPFSGIEISAVRPPEPVPTGPIGHARAPGRDLLPAYDGTPVHGYTAEQAREMFNHNRALSRIKLSTSASQGPYRPYADYENTGYLIMSSAFEFNSRQAKLEMAKNLPADAILVIFTDSSSGSSTEQILKDYENAVPRSRIKVISLRAAGGIGFWARDGIPVPVLGPEDSLTVIDAKYYHKFEPDAEISRLFKAGIEKHEYLFEGGNFQANSTGDCMIVNNARHAPIPDTVFSEMYGCKQLIRLPFIRGIGHVDERARFVSTNTIVTDTPEYKDLLEAKGFVVHLLPRPKNTYETYVNSLIMNDRVVVPVFGEPSDPQALAVYERLGLKASGADSSQLSNTGLGSVHCITMTYPKVPLTELIKALGAEEL